MYVTRYICQKEVGSKLTHWKNKNLQVHKRVHVSILGIKSHEMINGARSSAGILLTIKSDIYFFPKSKESSSRWSSYILKNFRLNTDTY